MRDGQPASYLGGIQSPVGAGFFAPGPWQQRPNNETWAKEGTAMSEQHAVILFVSTSHAIRAEKLLQGADIPCKMIPVPRHISSDCGVCVRIRRADAEAARSALEAAGMEIEGIDDV